MNEGGAKVHHGPKHKESLGYQRVRDDERFRRHNTISVEEDIDVDRPGSIFDRVFTTKFSFDGFESS